MSEDDYYTRRRKKTEATLSLLLKTVIWFTAGYLVGYELVNLGYWMWNR